VFELVVPATPMTEQEAALRHSEHLNGPLGVSGAVLLAEHRLHVAQAKLAELGIDAKGDLGDANPLKAVATAMAERPADVIVVSTLPRRRSRWLSGDVPGRLRRKHGIPVIHVEAAAKAPASRSDRHTPTAVTPLRHASHR
jgi:nucleotide-binding universal stress UspA family protein